MKENGLYVASIFSCDLNNPRSFQFLLKNKEYKKYPHLLETHQISPGVHDRVHSKEVDEMFKRTAAKVPALIERVKRKYEYLGKLNREYLESLSKEDAYEILFDRETFGLHWYERLPIGLTMQYVCDLLEISLTTSWWSGHVQYSESYKPNGTMKKSRIYAKRI